MPIPEQNTEQIKTNQLLEKVVNEATESKGKISELIDAVQQPSQYEVEAIASDKLSTELDKKAEKHDKQVLKQDKSFHKEFEDFSKKEIVHNKFIETTEKSKAGLAKAALADQKRKDKLSTRLAKGTWDWTKDKVKGLGKSVGSFLGNIAKLLALVGAWFVLNWLKGKDLKKIWENLRKKIDEFVDKWIPQWIQDLSFGEALGVAIGSFVAAWYALKATFWAAGRTLGFLGTSITNTFSKEGRLNQSIVKMNTQMAELLKKQNALKTARKFATNLDARSKINQELKITNNKIAALEEQIKFKISSMQNAQALADNLKAESKIGKQLSKSNKLIIKLTKKHNAVLESIKWAKNLDIESTVGKDLVKANAALTKAKADAKFQERQQSRIRANIARLNPKSAEFGKPLLADNQWINKDGRVVTGDITDTTKPGKWVKGEVKIPKKVLEKKPTTWERIKGKTSAFFQSGMENVQAKFDAFKQTKTGKALGTGITGVKVAGRVMWLFTKILNTLRGTWAGWKGVRDRGGSIPEAIMSAVAGGGHGFLQSYPMLIEFFETIIAKWGMGALNWVNMESGIKHKGFNEFAQWITNPEVAHHISSTLLKMGESAFRSYDPTTTIEGMTERGELSGGDFLGGFGVEGDKQVKALGPDANYADIAGVRLKAMRDTWLRMFELREVPDAFWDEQANRPENQFPIVESFKKLDKKTQAKLFLMLNPNLSNLQKQGVPVLESVDKLSNSLENLNKERKERRENFKEWADQQKMGADDIIQQLKLMQQDNVGMNKGVLAPVTVQNRTNQIMPAPRADHPGTDYLQSLWSLG